MKNHALAFVLSCATSLMAFGQYNETIRTGRPGQAIGPFVVGTGIFQLQSGMEYSENKLPLGSTTTASDIGSVFRYGTSDFFEVNAALNYSEQKTSNDVFSSQLNGWSQMELGVRTNILNSKTNFPSIGLQYRVKLPSVSPDFQSRQLASKATLATGQRLCKGVGLNTNWGINWNGNNGDANGFYVLSFSLSLTEKWGIVAEHYGEFDDRDINGKVDGGFSYLVNNDLQLDLLGGWGSLGVDDENFFAGIGVSVRTKKK
jgi:hypothetical protein